MYHLSNEGNLKVIAKEKYVIEARLLYRQKVKLKRLKNQLFTGVKSKCEIEVDKFNVSK